MAEIIETGKAFVPASTVPVKGQPYVVPTRDLRRAPSSSPPNPPSSTTQQNPYETLPSAYDQYMHYVESGTAASPKQLARDTESLKEHIRFQEGQRTIVGRQLADYQAKYKAVNKTTSGMTSTAEYQRLAGKYEAIQEEIKLAEKLEADLRRLRNAYGERPPAEAKPSTAPRPSYPYDYNPQTKTLTLPSGETIGGVEGFTRTASGELKEVIVSEGGKKYTIEAKTGNVTAVQDKKTYADLTSGQIYSLDNYRELDLLKEPDYKQAKELGLDFQLSEETKAASDWYYKEVEGLAKSQGAEAFALTVGQSMKGDAIAYLTKVTPTQAGYLIEAQGGAKTTAGYLETLDKAIESYSGQFQYAAVEKLGEGKYLVRQLPVKDPAYLFSKGFQGARIKEITLTEDLKEPKVVFEGGGEKKYSELTKTQKGAFDAYFKPILAGFEEDLTAQLQAPPAFRQTTDVGVRFEKQAGNWTLTGLDYYTKEAPTRQPFDFTQGYFRNLPTLPAGATEQDAVKMAAEAGRRAKEQYKPSGNRLIISTPGISAERASQLYGLESEGFYKNQISRYEKQAAQYPTDVVAEDFVKWGYGGWDLLPKKAILTVAGVGHEINKAITGFERTAGVDIPLAGNLSDLQSAAVEKKLSLESQTLEAEATAKFRKFWYGDYLGQARQGKLAEAYASYAASPPVVVGGSIALSPFVKAPKAIQSVPEAVYAAQTAGNLVKQFVTGGVTSVLLEESAATLAAPSKRPLDAPSEATAAFVAGGVSNVAFSALMPKIYNMLPLANTGGQLVLKRSLSGGLSMGTATAGYSVTKDVVQGKPINVERAAQYGAVGFAIGAVATPAIGYLGDKYTKFRVESGKVEYELRPTDEVIYDTGEGTYQAQIFGKGKIKTAVGEVKIESLYGEAGFIEQPGGSVYSGDITATFAGQKEAITYPVSGIVKAQNLGSFRLGSGVSYGDDIFKVEGIYTSGSSHGKMGGILIKEFEKGSKATGSYYMVEPEKGTFFKEMLGVGEQGREYVLIKSTEGNYFQDIGSRYLMKTQAVETLGDDFADQIGRKWASALGVDYVEPANPAMLEIKKTLFGFEAIKPQAMQFRDVTSYGTGRMYFMENPVDYGKIIVPEGKAYSIYETSPLMQIPTSTTSPAGLAETAPKVPATAVKELPAAAFTPAKTTQAFLQETPKEVIAATRQAAQLAAQKQIALQLSVFKSPELTQAAKMVAIQKAAQAPVQSYAQTLALSATPAILEEAEYSQVPKVLAGQAPQIQGQPIEQKASIPTVSISASLSRQLSAPKVSLIERPVERPIASTASRPLENLKIRPFERAVERPLERTVERPLERTIERPLERSIERPLERAIERPLERTLERAIERTISPTPPAIPPFKGFEIPFNFRLGTPEEARRRPPRQSRTSYPDFSRQGARTILADLLSVNRSIAQFGKATHPSARKRPGIWEYERKSPGGRVPTVELLTKKKKKTDGIANILKGLTVKRKRKGLL